MWATARIAKSLSRFATAATAYPLMMQLQGARLILVWDPVMVTTAAVAAAVAAAIAAAVAACKGTQSLKLTQWDRGRWSSGLR